MRWRVELSDVGQKQLARLPRDVRDRMERAIDEFEEKDEAQWSNIKALRGPECKGRFRKRVAGSFSGSPPTAASRRSRQSSSDYYRFDIQPDLRDLAVNGAVQEFAVISEAGVVHH